MARPIVRVALDQLREGGCLVQVHTRNGPKWFVIPDAGGGREVHTQAAARIIAHPGIRSNRDALFPGMSQTWSYR